MKHLFFLILLTISSSVLSQKIFNVYDSFTLELVDSVFVTTAEKKAEITFIATGICSVNNAKKGTQITFTSPMYETQYFDCTNVNNDSYSILLVPSNELLKSYKSKIPFYSSSGLTAEEKISLPKDSILSFTDISAEFPGGQSALNKFIGENIRYPQQAIELNISGKVFVQFVVRTTGEISNIKVAKGVNLPLDSESVRVVKKMPNWNPGTINGKPVNMYFNLPINFKLQ